MSRHGCGEAAESRRPDLEKERVEKKERNGGDGGEQKAGGRHSSVSYISQLNESVQKSELSDQGNRQTWPRNWNTVRNNTQMIRLCFMASWLPSHVLILF